jgi:hypothetical protein
MKTILIIIGLLITVSIYSQDIEYCELSYISSRMFAVKLYQYGISDALKDKRNEKIYNLTDALTIMSRDGWRFLTSYELQFNSGLSITPDIRFILYREYPQTKLRPDSLISVTDTLK